MADLHITFDRNAAEGIRRSSFRKGKKQDESSYLLTLIQKGKVAAYISASTLHFEIFKPEERLLVLAEYFATGELREPIPRDPIARQERWLGELLDLGFHVLKPPPRIGLREFVHVKEEAWAKDIRFPTEQRQNRQRVLVEWFEEERGLGEPRLRKFGEVLARHHDDQTLQKLTPYPCCRWYSGIAAESLSPKVFRTRREFLGTLRKVFSDWFDLDSVASHYGYGFDVFCTEDQGRGRPDESIFHKDNRAILLTKFDVTIKSPHELAGELWCG